MLGGQRVPQIFLSFIVYFFCGLENLIAETAPLASDSRAVSISDNQSSTSARDPTFSEVLNQAKSVPNKCESNLRKLSCLKSVWFSMELRERYQKVLDLARESVNTINLPTQSVPQKSGSIPHPQIDYRAIPCIAAAETGFLEPLAMNTNACTNDSTAKGLGMINANTLWDYLLPDKTFQLGDKKYNSLNREFNWKGMEMWDREIERIKSMNDKDKKEAKEKLVSSIFDRISLQPELQIQIIAYTLAEKQARVRRTQNSSCYGASISQESYSDYYSGCSSNDKKRNQERRFYGEAINSCAKCIAKNEDNTELSVKCLSIVDNREPEIKAKVALMAPAKKTNGKVEKTQKKEKLQSQFHLKPDEKILRSFEFYKKVVCKN